MTKNTLRITPPANGDEGIGFKTAVLLASVSPLSIVTMGTFPLSLIAWGRIRCQHFDGPLSLEANKNPLNATEELKSPQKSKAAELGERVETRKCGCGTRRLATT